MAKREERLAGGTSGDGRPIVMVECGRGLRGVVAGASARRGSARRLGASLEHGRRLLAEGVAQRVDEGGALRVVDGDSGMPSRQWSAVLRKDEANFRDSILRLAGAADPRACFGRAEGRGSCPPFRNVRARKS